jgi:hypothetical protein
MAPAFQCRWHLPFSADGFNFCSASSVLLTAGASSPQVPSPGKHSEVEVDSSAAQPAITIPIRSPTRPARTGSSQVDDSNLIATPQQMMWSGAVTFKRHAMWIIVLIKHMPHALQGGAPALGYQRSTLLESPAASIDAGMPLTGWAVLDNAIAATHRLQQVQEESSEQASAWLLPPRTADAEAACMCSAAVKAPDARLTAP